MKRTAIVVIAAAVAAAVAAVLAIALRGGDEQSRRSDPHGPVAISKARFDRILRATQAVSATTPEAQLVADGQALFRSAAVAKQGETCQGCHTNGGANPDLGTVVHPLSATDFKGRRDPPAFWGIARTAPYGWTGGKATLTAMVTGTVLGHFKEGATQPAEKTAEQAAAIIAYLKTFDPPVTSFDQGTMSASAQRGEELFRGKAGCISCHFGPLFTDNRLHNTGVPPNPADATDPGAASPPGAFNTPTLRDIAHTGPYMHNGSLKTLHDVIVFYDSGSSVSPLNLTPAEMDDLVAYLRAL